MEKYGKLGTIIIGLSSIASDIIKELYTLARNAYVSAGFADQWWQPYGDCRYIGDYNWRRQGNL